MTGHCFARPAGHPDAIKGARFEQGAGRDDHVQRANLELINQLDASGACRNFEVLMATVRLIRLSEHC